MYDYLINRKVVLKGADFFCAVGTIAGLRAELKCATETLIKARTSTVSVSSGCELFLRFITMTSLEETVCEEEMALCPAVLL